MSGKRMQRVRRTAQTTAGCLEIFNFLTERSRRDVLVASALNGDAPVSAISWLLAEHVGENALSSRFVKQFIGLCVRAILEEEGFELERTGIRLNNDAIFQTGAIYRKVSNQIPESNKHLLVRFLDSLNKIEIGFAIEFLKSKS